MKVSTILIKKFVNKLKIPEIKKIALFTLTFIANIAFYPAQAQVSTSATLYQTLKKQDSLLFKVGFNTCNIPAFETLVSDNFEFYHDQAGMMLSKAAFINSVKNNVCSLNYKASRELEPGSMKVYPL